MKTTKKILIYVAIILGILVAIVLGIFAFMYFSPNTNVLGFQYVKYEEKKVETYTFGTDISIANVNSIEITSDISDIYICPNDNQDEIVVEREGNYSGFVKTSNATFDTNCKIITKSFENTSGDYKTFCYSVEEPTGWVNKNDSYLKIYIPNSISSSSIYNISVKSNSGDVFYNSTIDNNNLACNNLYIKTNDLGKIEINNNQTINNYYLTTNSGNIEFVETNQINASLIKFETNSGNLKITNKDKNAILNSNLNIISNDKKNGPRIEINSLLGNLNVSSKKIKLLIDKIGLEENTKEVNIICGNIEATFNEMYGKVSLISDSTSIKNNVTINLLKNNVGDTSIFEIGKGSLKINDTNSDIAVDSTSGNVVLNKVNYNNNICICSKSGDININYDSSLEGNSDRHNDKVLKIITKTGNIDVNNISCFVDINVLEKSSKAKCTLSFLAVSNKDNKINSQDRNINLVMKGNSANLISRFLSQKEINKSSNVNCTKITSDENDNSDLNNDYADYLIRYRFGYGKEDATYSNNLYSSVGKILIKTSGLINVSLAD